MRDDWLIEVLQDIEAYAVLNELTWLAPLIEEAYAAARRELRPSVPVSEGRGRLLIAASKTRKPAVHPSSGRAGLVDFQSFKALRSRRPSS